MAFLAMLAYVSRTEVVANIRWQERSLTWNDFPKINNVPGDFDAMVYSDIQFENNEENQHLNIYAQMIPRLSGRVIEDDDDESVQLLIHEQNHFNITEYFARLFRKEAVALGKEELTNTKLQRLANKYTEQAEIMQEKYDTESKHNGEWPTQRYWELHVAGLLRETAFYENENLYSYQAFTGGNTKWFRKLYNTVEGEILTSFPEKAKNSSNGKIYNVLRKQYSIIVKFYQNGKPTNGGYFEAAITTITYPDTNTREVKLFDGDNKPYSLKTEAHITKTITAANGNITRAYFDENGEQIEKEGVYTLKGIWNATEKSMYSSYFNKEDKPVKRRGAFKECRTLGKNKITNKIAYFNLEDKPMRDQNFVSTYEFQSDTNFTTTSVKQFDVDGNFAVAIDGYNIKYENDERGNTQSASYFDESDKKAADKDGVHKYTYSYDIYENCTDVRKFNIRNLPTKGVNDYHQYVNLYDELGRNTFTAKYYPDYVLMFTDDKVGAIKYEYVGDFLKILTNVDAYGFEGVDDLGIMVTKQFLNKKKEVVREEFFGAENCWAKTKTDAVSYNYKYDERGNQTEMAAFDSLGKPHAWQEDVAITRWEYDENNKIKTTYFTVDNQLANAVEGTTYNFYKYDANNNLLERTNYDKAMKPSLVGNVFKTSCIVNKFGKDSIVTSFDVNNQILAIGGVTKYAYNPRGLLLSESAYNKQNKPILNSGGIHKTVYNYDKFDRYIGSAYFGKNGESINGTDGYARIEMKLNELGNVLTYTYLDQNNKPALGPDGFHKMTYYYNDYDEIVRISTYGKDQQLKNDADGIADYVYQIDKSGRTLRISYYDDESNLTEDTNGVAEYFYEPELNGLYYLEKQLDSHGEEVAIVE